MEENKKVTDKEMAKSVGGIIDNVLITGKKAARDFFNLMVERTSDTVSDLADKGVDKLKQKIEEKESDGKKQKDKS